MYGTVNSGVLMNKENCEEIVEINEKMVVTIIKEFTKDGAKMQVNSVGETKGKFNAAHTETIDVFQKMDGTNTWEGRVMDVTMDGDVIMMSGKGTGKGNSFQGECTLMTMSKKLAWLNSTKGWVEGTADQRNGKATLKVYSVK